MFKKFGVNNLTFTTFEITSSIVLVYLNITLNIYNIIVKCKMIILLL